MTLPGGPAPTPPGPPAEPALASPDVDLDLGLRVAGGFVAVVAAVVTALAEVILSALRVGTQPVGLSAVLAVVANVVLAWFAHRAVGRRWAVALPAVAWFAVMMWAGSRTPEGDVLLPGNTWVGVVTIFVGSIAFAVVAYRLILTGVPRPRR